MQATKPLTIHILGAGALGCLWACHFQRLGHSVNLIARHETTDGVVGINYVASFPDKNNQSIQGPCKWILRCTTAAKETIPIEHLVIATKSQDALMALQSVSHLLDRNVQVLTLCNGMGYHREIADYLHEQCESACFWAGICSDGACMSEHTLQHTGAGVSYAGQLFGYKPRKASPFFIEEESGKTLLLIACYAPIELKIAQKFFINCAINPLTVIYQCRNGELLFNPAAQEAFDLLCAELQRIYRAYCTRLQEKCSGLLPPEAADFDVCGAARSVATNTASNQSSMLSDYLKGKTLELTYLNRYLSTLARQLGIDAHQNNNILRKLDLLQSAKIRP